jgi:hypothetical protein
MFVVGIGVAPGDVPVHGSKIAHVSVAALYNEESRQMARQGCSLQDSEIRRIIQLLASTDLSLMDIAQRTGRSHAAIAAVNRRFQVRHYGGRRSTWALDSGMDALSSDANRTSKAA